MERQLDVTDIQHGAVLDCLNKLRQMNVKARAYSDTRALIVIEYPETKSRFVEDVVRESLGSGVWNTSFRLRSFRRTAAEAAQVSDYSFDDAYVELPNGRYMAFNDWLAIVTDVTSAEMFGKWIDYYTTYEGISKENLTEIWNESTFAVKNEIIDVFIHHVFISMDRIFKVYSVRIVSESKDCD